MIFEKEVSGGTSRRMVCLPCLKRRVMSLGEVSSFAILINKQVLR